MKRDTFTFHGFKLPSPYTPLRHLRLKHQRRQKAQDQSSRDPHRGLFKPAVKDSHKALAVHSFLDSLKQQMTETDQRNRGAGFRPVGKRLVDANGAQHCSQAYQKDHNPPGKKFCVVHDDLYHRTDGTAY